MAALKGLTIDTGRTTPTPTLTFASATPKGSAGTPPRPAGAARGVQLWAVVRTLHRTGNLGDVRKRRLAQMRIDLTSRRDFLYGERAKLHAGVDEEVLFDHGARPWVKDGVMTRDNKILWVWEGTQFALLGVCAAPPATAVAVAAPLTTSPLLVAAYLLVWLPIELGFDIRNEPWSAGFWWGLIGYLLCVPMDNPYCSCKLTP